MAGMYVYPNQKVVTLNKAPTDASHLFGVFNKEALFAACRLLTGNELKVYLYLVSNQNGYRWALSPEDIAEKVGSTTDGIRTAIRGLIKKGYMVNRGKNQYDAYEEVLVSSLKNYVLTSGKETKEDCENQELIVGKVGGYEAEITGEIIQEEYKKNTKDNNLKEEQIELSAEWRDVFKEINVTLYPYTMRKLDEAVGKSPDIHVIHRLIAENRASFQKGINEKEGYRLSTLVNLAKNQYEKWEAVITVEDAERQDYLEKLMRRPRINYDRLPAMQDFNGGGDSQEDIVELLLNDESLWGVSEVGQQTG